MDVISILRAFAEAGLWWNDFRTHNLIQSDHGLYAVDFEGAVPVERENTLNLFIWFLNDLQCSTLTTQANQVFKNGVINVPRPPMKSEDFKESIRDIAVTALASRDIRDFLRRL